MKGGILMNAIPFSNVTINGGFWKAKQDLVRGTTVQETAVNGDPPF